MEAIEVTPINKTTALAKVAPTPQGLAPYEPRNFDEAMRLATVYASSGMLGEVRSNEAAFLIMSTGAELGIPATTALRAIHIIKGKPILSSDLIVALCLKRTDLCEYFICTESTETTATFETKRHGVPTPQSNTFTIEDSRRAKLGLEWDKSHGRMVESSDSNWAKYPKAMLRHRAAAELARMVYPDIVLGLYTEADRDEIERDTFDVRPVQQLVTEPVREQEVVEDLSVRMKRWLSEMSEAKTLEDCERIRRESKGQVAKGAPGYDDLAKAYSSRVKALKVAPVPISSPVVEGEIVTREPGAEG